MFNTACTGSDTPCSPHLVVNQCGLDVRDLIRNAEHAVLTLTNIKGTFGESAKCIYAYHSAGASTAEPIRICDSCIDRPPFSPVQLEGMAKEGMCLSCSSEAVPYDSLVDMLFFQLPLGAENNLAVPLNPALNSSSSSQRRVVQ
jgi:hypothetical protein